jgi:RNA polymerase sigma factor for flagellar operon FliA
MPEQSMQQELMVVYVQMVQRMAWRLGAKLPRHVDREDLIGAGLLGLSDAMAKYRGDPALFANYASYRIRGAMADRRGDPLSRGGRAFARRAERVARKLSQVVGRNPTEEEVVQRLAITLADFRKRALKNRAVAVTSFERVRENGWEEVDEVADGAEVQLLRAEREEHLEAAVRGLDERLQTVVRLRYEHDYTLREIGEELGSPKRERASFITQR